MSSSRIKAQKILVQAAAELNQERDTPRQRILDEASQYVHKDRNANYGNPEHNFRHIANFWNAYLRVTRPQAAVITPADVANMNILIKMARLANNPMHHDSAVDVAGYAACLGDIQESSLGQNACGTCESPEPINQVKGILAKKTNPPMNQNAQTQRNG